MPLPAAYCRSLPDGGGEFKSPLRHDHVFPGQSGVWWGCRGCKCFADERPRTLWQDSAVLVVCQMRSAPESTGHLNTRQSLDLGLTNPGA